MLIRLVTKRVCAAPGRVLAGTPIPPHHILSQKTQVFADVFHGRIFRMQTSVHPTPNRILRLTI